MGAVIVLSEEKAVSNGEPLRFTKVVELGCTAQKKDITLGDIQRMTGGITMPNVKAFVWPNFISNIEEFPNHSSPFLISIPTDNVCSRVKSDDEFFQAFWAH